MCVAARVEEVMPVYNPFCEAASRYVSPSCVVCGTRLRYSAAVDARYCAACDRWAEPMCWDPGCSWCWHRPSRPSELKYPDLGEGRSEADLEEERWDRKIGHSRRSR